MEKMMKHNNGLTAVTAVLSAACCFFSYANWTANAALQHDITNIKHAMHYELHIDVDAADRGDNRDRGERTAKTPLDMAFDRRETETTPTKN